jgi:hypothetical protein
VLDPLPEEDEEPQQELTEAEIKHKKCVNGDGDFPCRTESQNVKNLAFTVPLKSRHNDDLLQAVAKLYLKTPSSTDSYR